MLSPIDCVKRVIECDNGRDAKGYRAVLDDDYISYVHGKEMTVGPEDEVVAIERWWAAASDVHLEPITIVETDGLVTLRYTLTGTNDGDLFGQPATGSYGNRCQGSTTGDVAESKHVIEVCRLVVIDRYKPMLVELDAGGAQLQLLYIRLATDCPDNTIVPAKLTAILRYQNKTVRTSRKRLRYHFRFELDAAARQCLLETDS